MFRGILNSNRCYLCNNSTLLQQNNIKLNCPNCKLNNLFAQVNNLKIPCVASNSNIETKVIPIAEPTITVLEELDKDNQTLQMINVDNDNQDSSSEDEEISYNIDDYVVKDYEKDLEMAIKESLQNVESCIICCDNSINAVFVPCGHYCCCHICAKKCKKKCPICRKKYKIIQKVYK